MQKLGLNEIREKYLAFFESKGHLRLSSFSLVPQKDPSLLLINSGMAPLKPYFTGAEVPPCKRITTCQKCIRTPDIENVGKTARHGTFFEMLGNFSFGDYFKNEATEWAWEFVTAVLEIPQDKIFISIYEDDDEAFEIWTKRVGVPANRIVRMGKDDNFWEHGTGPCGPCSEIYFDRGEHRGCGKPDCKVGCECDRYIEFWNLVFTQFDKKDDGRYEKLAKPNIDTGMGLERLACVMQDVENLFEVDTIHKILKAVCEMAQVTYHKDSKTDVSIRVITDHIRSTVMMISDGVIPSNEGRGYVLRRLLRRAARHGKLLGIKGLFLDKISKVVIQESAEAYPNLIEKHDFIEKIIRIEEERFEATIGQGMTLLMEIVEQKIKDGPDANGKMIVSGEVAFKLHDTYGFPLDLTREIFEEKGLEVDEEGFKVEMEAQKTMARHAIKNRQSSWGGGDVAIPEECPATHFTGYDKLVDEGKILYLLTGNGTVQSAGDGEDVIIVTDVSPFYAESGGQTGDIGMITTDASVVRITDTRKTADGKFRHVGNIESGVIEQGDKCTLYVDVDQRKATERNHTATHILQKALKNILGEHVHQAGSSVSHERLRFDFNHFQAVTKEELAQVEDEMNRIIYEDLSVSVKEMNIQEAKKLGAMALFGEKYGDVVRVVIAGDYSKEFCGGTHVKATGTIGIAKILYEGAVAAGIRRIEAVTGAGARAFYQEKEEVLENISVALKSNVPDALAKVESLNSSYRAVCKELDELKKSLAGDQSDTVLKNAQDVKGFKLVTGRFDTLEADALRDIAEALRSKISSGVVVLASSYGDKVSLVAMATKDAVSKGAHCGNIIKKAAAIVGGGGGGRPDMAQAGGKDISAIDKCLSDIFAIVNDLIK